MIFFRKSKSATNFIKREFLGDFQTLWKNECKEHDN